MTTNANIEARSAIAQEIRFLRRVIQAYPDPSTVAWHRYGIHTLRQLARVHFSKTDRPVNVPAQVAA